MIIALDHLGRNIDELVADVDTMMDLLSESQLPRTGVVYGQLAAAKDALIRARNLIP